MGSCLLRRGSRRRAAQIEAMPPSRTLLPPTPLRGGTVYPGRNVVAARIRIFRACSGGYGCWPDPLAMKATTGEESIGGGPWTCYSGTDPALLPRLLEPGGPGRTSASSTSSSSRIRRSSSSPSYIRNSCAPSIRSSSPSCVSSTQRPSTGAFPSYLSLASAIS